MINVVHGDERAIITLFEDAAATFVGCPIGEYLSSIKKVYNIKLLKDISSQFLSTFSYLNLDIELNCVCISYDINIL